MMGQMAREVASRVLEEGARCLLWEKPQGVPEGVCWQAAGGMAGGVAFGVTRRTGEVTEVTAVATATPSEGQTTDDNVCGQAPALLCGGRMPLLCPARRLWQKDERVTLPGGLAWPPKDSAAMSADIKLLYTEHAAMTLATSAGLQLHNRRDLLDDFRMLVLPGTALPAAAIPAQKAREHLVDAVRLPGTTPRLQLSGWSSSYLCFLVPRGSWRRSSS